MSAVEVFDDAAYLAHCAERVHEECRRDHDAHGESTEAKFAMGRALLDARRALPRDQEYGLWFRDQKFGFTHQWAGLLRMAAEHEQLVRSAVETQVSTGSQPNFRTAVRTVRDSIAAAATANVTSITSRRSNERVEAIRSLVAEGLNAAQIAERLEVSTHTTYEIAHSAGIVLGKKSRLAIAARVTRTAELARQGATSQQIAAELGVGVEVIKRYARDHPEIAIPADAASVVRTIDSTRIVISTIDAIDGIGSMFDHIDYSDLPGDQVEGWISVLTTSIRSLTTLKKHLKKEIQP